MDDVRVEALNIHDDVVQLEVRDIHASQAYQARHLSRSEG